MLKWLLTCAKTSFEEIKTRKRLPFIFCKKTFGIGISIATGETNRWNRRHSSPKKKLIRQADKQRTRITKRNRFRRCFEKGTELDQESSEKRKQKRVILLIDRTSSMFFCWFKMNLFLNWQRDRISDNVNWRSMISIDRRANKSSLRRIRCRICFHLLLFVDMHFSERNWSVDVII